MRFLRRALFAILVLGLLFVAVAFALRDRLVTGAAATALDGAGIHCDPLALDVGWSFQSVRVAPTRCRFPEGKLAAIGVPQGADVTLSGLRLATVVAPVLSVEMPTARLPDGAAIAFLDTQATPPMKEAISNVAALAARDDVPDVRLGELDLAMGDRTLAVRDLALRREANGGLVITIAEVGAAPGQPAHVDLAGHLASLEGHATPATATLTGRVVLDLDVGPSDLDRSVGFTITGSELATTAPRYAIWLERSERVDRLRALVFAHLLAGHAGHAHGTHSPRTR